MFCIGIIAVIVICWCGLNYYQNGYFEFSNISDINLIGKMLQYGFLDPGHIYKDAPEIILKIINLKFAGYGDNAYVILNELEKDPKIKRRAWYNKTLINSYLMKHNYFDFINKTVVLMPNVFVTAREGYEGKYAQRFIYIQRPNSMHRFMTKIDIFFDSLNEYKFWAFLINIIFAIILLILRKEDESIAMLFFLITIITNIITLSTFGYCDYTRLRAPIDFLMNFTVVFIFIMPFQLKLVKLM